MIVIQYALIVIVSAVAGCLAVGLASGPKYGHIGFCLSVILICGFFYFLVDHSLVEFMGLRVNGVALVTVSIISMLAAAIWFTRHSQKI